MGNLITMDSGMKNQDGSQMRIPIRGVDAYNTFEPVSFNNIDLWHFIEYRPGCYCALHIGKAH